MPVARPAIHSKPECRTALVRELRVAASAAGNGERCGTQSKARRVYAGPECADRFLPWSNCRAERPSVTKSKKDSSDIPLEKANSLNHKKSFLKSQLYV